MAINIDTSKPLTDEQIEELRTRLPENLVQRYVELSNADQAPAQEDEGDKPKAASRRGSKADDILT
jgi:hypothetical protein